MARTTLVAPSKVKYETGKNIPHGTETHEETCKM